MNASIDSRHLLDAPLASARALPFRSRVQHLEIVRAIAETDLGLEYLAIDTARDCEVVLKEYLPARLARRDGTAMRPHTAAEAAALAHGLQAFIAGPELLARTDHPALARVIGVVEANDTAYHVMSHGAGTQLLQLRQEMNGAPDERTLRALLDDLLGALEALHQDGVVHGAVAPNRILLLADDRPLLLGPEPARTRTSSDLIESLMASVEPSFAAPERRDPSSTQALGAATDLYGLAETMRFCISGELPPRAGGPTASEPREPMAQMVQRLFGGLLTPHYSASLLGTLDAALDVNPLMRPQSAAEFRAALGVMPEQAAVRVEPAFHIDPSPPVRAETPAVRTARPQTIFRPPSAQRRWWPWACTALVLLLAAAAYGWWRFDLAARIAPPTAVIAPIVPGESIAPITPTAPTESIAPSEPSVPSAPIVVAPTPKPIAEAAPPPTIVAAPPAPAKVVPSSSAALASPRDSCAGRTQFALYRCMQVLCEQRGWATHPQCERLRITDNVE